MSLARVLSLLLTPYSISSVAQDCDREASPRIEEVALFQVDGRVSNLWSSGDGATDWSTGRASWQNARSRLGGAGLWTRPNKCEKQALAGSAPLTTLFGISEFWHEIRERRRALGKTHEQLEVHVLGAAYPFEGRADWSLLSQHKPADMAGVRVVLVLGTPWQADNVPSMQSAKEYDSALSLMQIGKSAASENSSKCSKAPAGDTSFSKADLCRKYGTAFNSLEVVCVEKYYQDVSDELPKPDLVVMFSPGFPQLGRRSWDVVLRNILAQDVPIMVADLFLVKPEMPLSSPEMGADWDVKLANLPLANTGKMLRDVLGEDSMTLVAMLAYGAHRVAARRNPFPIITPGNAGQPAVHKNGVLQVFRGWNPTKASNTMPSAAELEHNAEVIRAARLDEASDSGREFADSLLTPTSRAYDESMWRFYRDGLRELVEKHEAQAPKRDPAYKDKLKQLGLFGNSSRKAPWGMDDWIFILKDLDVGRRMMDEVF